jgi:hypothetical protein
MVITHQTYTEEKIKHLIKNQDELTEEVKKLLKVKGYEEE